MSRLRSEESGATANILDMSYKEIRIKFKETAIVGVGNGMFYCDATEVVDTTMKDSPMTLSFLVTGSNFRILALSVPPNPNRIYNFF
jgi:hypothetical protein